MNTDSWPLCDNCRDGYLGEHIWEQDDGYGERIEMRQLEPCPSCVGGRTIPATIVEAGAEGIYREDVFVALPGVPVLSWGTLVEPVKDAYRVAAKAVLLAAFRAMEVTK